MAFGQLYRKPPSCVMYRVFVNAEGDSEEMQCPNRARYVIGTTGYWQVVCTNCLVMLRHEGHVEVERPYILPNQDDAVRCAELEKEYVAQGHPGVVVFRTMPKENAHVLRTFGWK